MIDYKEFEVWFVTGSQDLYGEATLKKVAEHSREMAQWMTQSGKLPVKVVFKPVVISPEAITSLIREANNAQNCIGLIMLIKRRILFFLVELSCNDSAINTTQITTWRCRGLSRARLSWR